MSKVGGQSKVRPDYLVENVNAMEKNDGKKNWMGMINCQIALTLICHNNVLFAFFVEKYESDFDAETNLRTIRGFKTVFKP